MFGIISGQYSDWHIEGYVETEDEAITACVMNNAKMNDDCYFWYYVEVNKLSVDSPLIEGYHLYKVTFDSNCSMLYCHDGFSYLYPVEKRPPKLVAESKDGFMVEVTAKDKEHAKKIAQDYLMYEVAIRNILT